MGGFCCSNRFEDKEEMAEIQRKQRISSNKQDFSNNASLGDSFDFSSNLNNIESEEREQYVNGFKYSKDIDINNIESVECEFAQITPKFNSKDSRFNFKASGNSSKKSFSRMQTKRDYSCPNKRQTDKGKHSSKTNEEDKFDELLEDFKRTLRTHKKQNRLKIDSCIKERERNFALETDSNSAREQKQITKHKYKQSFTILKLSSDEEF